MNKTKLKKLIPSVSNSKTHKSRNKVTNVVSERLIRSMVSRRIDELSLPPMRTLIENKEQFKSILTDRAAESIEQKLKQPEYNRLGEDVDNDISMTISCFNEPKYKRKIQIDKVARAKYFSQSKLKAVKASEPSRIDVLSKPLKRRLPEPVLEKPIICNVKPRTLRYVANARILELAKPKKSQHKVTIKKKRKKKGVSRYSNRKRY